MSVVSSLTVGSNASEDNSFEGQGRRAKIVAYASTSALTFLPGCAIQRICYAQLTGAMTINATLSGLRQWDEVEFHFGTDGTQRIVTFGTGFKSSGTVTIPASKGAVVRAVYNGTDLMILSREIWA